MSNEKKKEHYIGARFTKNEKNLIESFCNNLDINKSIFIRKAVEEHITGLSNKKIIEQIKVFKRLLEYEDMMLNEKSDFKEKGAYLLGKLISDIKIETKKLEELIKNNK